MAGIGGHWFKDLLEHELVELAVSILRDLPSGRTKPCMFSCELKNGDDAGEYTICKKREITMSNVEECGWKGNYDR